MKDKGLGTPATRAATIERLIEVGYVERSKKSLLATQKGHALIRVLPVRELLSPELTGDWEKRLAMVENGHMSARSFAEEMRVFVQRVIAQMSAMPGERIVDIAGPCPKCGAAVELRGQAFKCPACSFYVPLTIAGRKMTRDNVAVLLEKRRTPLLYGFRSKAGGRFKAHLVLADDLSIKFEFAKPRKKKTARKPKDGAQLDPRIQSGG
jgi:DNA topoisomerase-3